LRDNNEDAYLLRDTGMGSGAAIAALAVADGMGGYEDGQVASRLAIDMAGRVLGDGAADSASIQQAFARADEKIRTVAMADGSRRSMGTTLTFAVVHQGEALVGHVGDTRAWLFHQGSLQQITADHSRVGRLLRAGVITEEDAIGHPDANVLEQALGAGDRPSVDMYRLGVGPGDVLLLSSDGMHGSVHREEIEAMLREHLSMQDVCDRLASLALAKGSSDNVTVVAWKHPVAGRRTLTNPGSPAPVAAAAPRTSASTRLLAPAPAIAPTPSAAAARGYERLQVLAGGFAVGFTLGVILYLLGRR
jgi:protein phosphatase